MNRFIPLIILSMLLLGSQNTGFAQAPKDTLKQSNTAFIEILEGDYTDIIKTENDNITKIVGNVSLRSGTDLLYCDSAILYQERKVAEAFGNVSIEQADGTTGYADYLRYTGGAKTIFMKGNVVLSDPESNTLWSEEVDYNLNTKIGKYYKDGTLQNDQTILSSKYGEYNLKTKNAKFKGDVVVNDPEYNATSEDISYNTESKLVRFFANAIIQNENATLFAKPGSTYDALKKLANFKGRSNIIYGAQFIEGDDLKYNQNTGWAMAKGNVIAIDTAEKATAFGNLLTYNEHSQKMMVTGNPILRKAGEKDTMYLTGDTVFSEPIANLERPNAGPIDTAKMEMDKLIEQLQSGVTVDSTKIPLQNSRDTDTIDTKIKSDLIDGIDTSFTDEIDTTSLEKLVVPEDTSMVQVPLDSVATPANPSSDTIPATLSDTGRPQRPSLLTQNPAGRIYDKSEASKNKDEEHKPRYFLVYHNARVFSDSAQAKCDSIRYSQADSLMILYNNPVVWSKGAEVLGDTIFALVDSNKIHEVYVPRNAILIQKNGPEQAGLFDQIQGNRLHAFFTNNELDSALAYPNAETIYFPVDDDSAYIGGSKASSDRLKLLFNNRKIKRIIYLKDFKQTTTPMKDVEPTGFRLSRFNWREVERPKTLEDFLQDASDFQKKELLGIPIPKHQAKPQKPKAKNKK